MDKEYRRSEWREFSKEIIRSSGNECFKCGRSGDHTKLVAHHKRYINGRKKWEYAYDDFDILCMGCHAGIHGHIPPQTGWSYVDEEDLGGLYGNCEKCQTEIRYVFYVSHPGWRVLGVGTICCDYMTGTTEASEIMRRQVSYLNRKNYFKNKSKWKIDHGKHIIKRSGLEIQIAPFPGKYKLILKIIKTGEFRTGVKEFTTVDDAKNAVFDVLEYKYDQAVRAIKRKSNVLPFKPGAAGRRPIDRKGERAAV